MTKCDLHILFLISTERPAATLRGVISGDERASSRNKGNIQIRKTGIPGPLNSAPFSFRSDVRVTMFPRILSRAHRSVLYSRRILPIRRTMASQVDKTAVPFDKTALEVVLNRRFFYAPAFEIYGGAWPITCGGLHTEAPQVPLGSTTMALQAPRCRRTSSRNGGNTSSSRSICSNLTQRL